MKFVFMNLFNRKPVLSSEHADKGQALEVFAKDGNSLNHAMGLETVLLC